MNHKMKHQICGQVKGPISCKYLLSMLYDLSDSSGEFVMSAEKIRRMTGFSVSTIRRAMHRLDRLGFIGITSRYNEDGGRASNQYTLKLR